MSHRSKLDELIANWEGECVEFKQAGREYETQKIGRYFSALSNEANLRGQDAAWLVFGVDDKSRTIVGTEYRRDRDRLDSLKNQIRDGNGRILSFVDIHVLDEPEGRVILFEIPPAPTGLPVAWNGHFYARAGESLVALDISKVDKIRGDAVPDWSAVPCPDAKLEDLDPAALQKAKEVFPQFSTITPEEVTSWDDEALLRRLGLLVDDQLNRAAILLLGRPESEVRISPHVAEITWKLIGEENAYQHFGPPFLLATTQVFQQIRNIDLRYDKPGDLIPLHVKKYDQRMVLEALHNCIAHQDYQRCERMVVIERSDELIFENAGSFFEFSPEAYLQPEEIRPRRYRNRVLVKAMRQLGMVNTVGFGIRDVLFIGQARRFLPLPEYDLSTPERVVLRLPGRFGDPEYSQVLMEQLDDFSLPEILALDSIQKGKGLDDVEMIRRLRGRKLIEGRKPNFRLVPMLAKSTEAKATYIRHRSFDDQHWADMIVEYLKKFGEASKSDIRTLIAPKLSEQLTEDQKDRKIGNLLQKMKREGTIVPKGSRKAASWRLPDQKEDA